MLQRPNLRKVFKDSNKTASTQNNKNKVSHDYGAKPVYKQTNVAQVFFWGGVPNDRELATCFLAINPFESSSPGALRLHTSDTRVNWTAAEVMTPDTCPLHSQRSTLHWKHLCILEELVHTPTLWKVREFIMQCRCWGFAYCRCMETWDNGYFYPPFWSARWEGFAIFPKNQLGYQIKVMKLVQQRHFI